jgi:type I restriction enzyme S subunit
VKNAWQNKRLAEVLEVQNGYAFDSNLFSNASGVPLIRIRDLKAGTETETRYTGSYEDKYLVSAGDLLIGMDGEFGCYQWKGSPALLNQRVCRLRGFNGGLLPRFLFYGVNSHLRDIEEFTTFTTVKHLSSKQILGIEFPVPSIAEQQRIVGILDKSFEAIATAKAHAEKNLQNARAIFESHLEGTFRERGDRTTDRQLSTLCREITVGHVGSMAKEYKESGVPFLRSQNIRPFEVTLENLVFIDEAFHRSLKKSRLQPGDLAIVRTGYPGTAAVIPEDLPDANCSDLVIVRTKPEVNPHFLAAFFNSSFGKRLVLGKLVGAAQKHFNVTAAKEVVLHVPAMAEQVAIIKMVDALREATQRLESVYGQKAAALDHLKKSLLDQAFSGQL